MTGPPVPHLPPSAPIGKFKIGVSPIGSIPLFDYWATVISQYANSPALTGIITNFFQAEDLTVLTDQLFDKQINIDTATGYGLDAWGRILGIARTVQLWSGKVFLGFAEPHDPAFESFGFGIFYSGSGLTTPTAEADASFRLLLLAKALTNITIGSIPAINHILLSLFPGRGNAFVTDNGGMNMTYTFTYPLSQLELAILKQTAVLPKPVGVHATIVTP